MAMERLLTGNDVRALRERLHLSQEALARILQVAMSSVHRWETRTPSVVVRFTGGVGPFIRAREAASHRDTELIRHMPDWLDRGEIYFWARIFALAYEHLKHKPVRRAVPR